MNKSGLVIAVASQTGLSKKDTETVVDSVFEKIKSALVKNEDVRISDFGKLEIRHRNARKGRNPQTGEEIEIPSSKSVGFKPSKSLKESIK